MPFQANITLRVHGPTATAIRFVAAASPVVAPVTIGTVFGQIQIDPPGWAGDVGVSGPDSAMIGVDPHMQVVATAPLTAIRDYVITVTATE